MEQRLKQRWNDYSPKELNKSMVAAYKSFTCQAATIYYPSSRSTLPLNCIVGHEKPYATLILYRFNFVRLSTNVTCLKKASTNVLGL